jgi:tetratricopeptide (TPR) repeat protein
VVARQGDYALGKELAESAIRLFEASGTEPDELRHAYITLAINEHKLGNIARGREIYDAVRANADERSLATILGNLGNIALEEHDYAAARAYLEEAAATNRRLAHQNPLANNLIDLGFIALSEARLDGAAPLLQESLAICRAERLGDLLPWAVEGVAALALGRGAPSEAVRLLAATTSTREELAMSADFYPVAEETRERTLEQARAQLSESAFAAAWAEGEALSLEQAAELAARE